MDENGDGLLYARTARNIDGRGTEGETGGSPEGTIAGMRSEGRGRGRIKSSRLLALPSGGRYSVGVVNVVGLVRYAASVVRHC